MPYRRPALAIAVVTAITVALVGPQSRTNASAASVTSGGWTTSATVTPTTMNQGATASIAAKVSSASNKQALIDVEVYGSSGTRVDQAFWNAQSFTAGHSRVFKTVWTVPTQETAGVYTVKIGVFNSGWGTLQHWNNSAGSFSVSASNTTTKPSTTTTAPSTTTTPPSTTTTPPSTTTTPPSTTTTPPSTTTTAPSTTTTTPSTTTTTVSSGTSHFSTLPPGSALPSDAVCASEVRPAPEVRPANATFNQTRGIGGNSLYPRVTGNYVGTTDEIIQWAACKWGIDEDIVRAQAAKESYWFQRATGDFTTDTTNCAPGHQTLGADGVAGRCPESIGLLQVRYPYHMTAFATDNDATVSTAYNLDYAYAGWRSCYEGNDTWLNNANPPRPYVAGDVWGCVGVWYSGAWYSSAADGYIAAVQSYLSQRVWETTSFLNDN